MSRVSVDEGYLGLLLFGTGDDEANWLKSLDPQPLDWRPLADMPEELKDGRDVLLWFNGFPAVGTYNCYDCWNTLAGPRDGVTHYAQIFPPQPKETSDGT